MIVIDSTQIVASMKPMHSTNNGPPYGPAYRRAGTPRADRSNFETFSQLCVPYVRNHDASLSEAYGSQHVVDVHCIFPDFSRDVEDETAYDFAMTDAYNENIIAAGSKVFYRLGASIEHWKRKYGTVVPADFTKWARICEHIIMHYNEGWANGFHQGITYWEIWNEPDNVKADGSSSCWQGTVEQFYDLYEVAAKHLKGRFPDLKIGGPALASKEDWAEKFLREMARRQVPMDFFSWHIYTTDPQKISAKAKRIQKLMDDNGYGDAENILNEWNYVTDWMQSLTYVRAIKGMKGAAFSAAVLCEGQNSPELDMLMYYDARIEKTWNGMFSSDTLEPIKGYYPFKMFNTLYQLGNQTACTCEDRDIYVVSASNGNEKAAMIAYYTMDENAVEKAVTVQTDFSAGVACYLLDETHDCEKIMEYDSARIVLHMKPNTAVLLCML